MITAPILLQALKISIGAHFQFTINLDEYQKMAGDIRHFYQI
jgi:hypothetical protein